MDISIVLVVLGAAFLHAFWNFLVRGAHDKALGMAAVMFGDKPNRAIALRGKRLKWAVMRHRLNIDWLLKLPIPGRLRIAMRG